MRSGLHVVGFSAESMWARLRTDSGGFRSEFVPSLHATKATCAIANSQSTSTREYRCEARDPQPWPIHLRRGQPSDRRL